MSDHPKEEHKAHPEEKHEEHDEHHGKKISPGIAISNLIVLPACSGGIV